MGQRWSKRQQNNARIVMARSENKQQGRPTYAGTGKKGKPCGALALAALAVVGSYVYMAIQIGRWVA